MSHIVLSPGEAQMNHRNPDAEVLLREREQSVRIWMQLLDSEA